MASRLALSSLRGARVAPRALIQARAYATQPSPEEKASEIINKVPSSSLWTKTGGILLGTGLTAAAVSNELYVANEETVLFVGFLVILAAISKSIVAPYNSWAEGHIGRIRDILYKAKDNHASQIKTRLDSLESLKDVVPLTQQLYSVSKETNAIEHENFLLQQESNIKSELKAVLDSWVRYEQQQREAEQNALYKTVTANVASELAKPATQKALLEEALVKIESLSKSKEI